MVRNLKQTPPNRHLVALLTFLTLIPLVYFIPPLIEYYLTDNRLIVTVLAVGVIVPIISYLALPMLLRTIRYFANRH